MTSTTNGGQAHQPVRWGILGTARIGWEKVIPAMQKSPWCDIRAIASRSKNAAATTAASLGIPVAYGTYEELLDDPQIEAIYNPLPNHLHVPLTLAAAAKGKHVLCEKPIALNAREAEGLRAAAANVLIAEAFMVRFHPQWLKARELLRNGKIGRPVAVQVLFSYFNNDPANIRNQPSIGGGAVLDIGGYAMLCGRFAFEAEPIRVVSLIDRDAGLGIDRTTSALIDFGEGRHLTFTVSTQAAPFQRVNILGTGSRIEIEIPFNAPQGGAMRIFVDDGSKLAGDAATVITLPAADQYELQGTAFAKAVRGIEALSYGIEDAILNMRIIDAMFRSERSGGWERP